MRNQGQSLLDLNSWRRNQGNSWLALIHVWKIKLNSWLTLILESEIEVNHLERESRVKHWLTVILEEEIRIPWFLNEKSGSIVDWPWFLKKKSGSIAIDPNLTLENQGQLVIDPYSTLLILGLGDFWGGIKVDHWLTLISKGGNVGQWSTLNVRNYKCIEPRNWSRVFFFWGINVIPSKFWYF